MNPRLLSALLVITALGCSKGNFSAGAASRRSATFTYPLSSGIVTLDPGKVQDVDMTDVLQNVFEGLVSYNEKNEIAPQLAEKWTTTDGGRTYLFSIRKDAKFTNGRPVTADDFKWSMERSLNPVLGSPVASTYLHDIVGVKEYIAGKATEIAGLKARDTHTLAITIDKPRPYFLGNLTYPCTFVLAKEAAGPQMITKKEQAVGTGPFKFETIAQDQEIVLVANNDYYLGKPQVAEIRRPIIKDASTRLNKYRAGEIDTLTLSREDVASISADPKLAAQLHYENRPAVIYFGLNENSYPPFRDARVRKAFAMALNRPHIVNDLLPGYLEARGLVPVGVPGAQPDFKGLPYDPAEARNLLAAAGYPGGKGLPPVELAYREATPDSRIACEGAATSLTENLGVKINRRSLEWGAMLELRNRGKLQMFLLSWYADYLDPQNFLSLLLTTKSEDNRDGYSNPKFDDLCDRADVEQDAAKRMKMYQEAEAIVVNEAGRIPIYFQVDPVLISPRVKGIRANLLSRMPNLTVSVGG